jgi:hypothetical protein
MRTRRPLLHLATLAVVVAVGAHLLMHLQPHATGSESAELHTTHAAVIGAQTTTALPGATGDEHGHLMAALCMAVLAVAALSFTRRLVGWIGPTTTALRTTMRGVAGQLLRAPPNFPGRVDAGVLLRV